MSRLDKKIICNNNLQQPDSATLNPARAYMDNKRAEKKRIHLSWKAITAIASSAIAIVFLAIFLPIILTPSFHTDQRINVGVDDMTYENIESISKYAANNNISILSFEGTPKSCKLYFHNEQPAYLVEERTVNGSDLLYFVKLKYAIEGSKATDGGYIYDIEQVFIPYKVDEKFEVIYKDQYIWYHQTYANITVTYMEFQYQDNFYMIGIAGENIEWQSIIQKLL